MAARLGCSDGVLVDLSVGGASFRHAWPVKRDAVDRLTFEWPQRNFASVVRVLASRLVGIDGQEAVYESRLRFVKMSVEASAALTHVIRALANEQLKTSLANLVANRLRSDATLKCRSLDGRCEIDEGELNTLCNAHGPLDGDGRHLLRLFANAAIA